MINTDPIIIERWPDEVWWGGASHLGTAMPFGDKSFPFDLRADLQGNQGSPFLVSSQGRSLWSDSAFRVEFEGRQIRIWSASESILNAAAKTLRDAYLLASGRFFAPSGAHPPDAFFDTPQYNTWIEIGYQPTQDKVLAYAHDILTQGFRQAS